MNERRPLGLLTVVVCWSAVLWIACGGQKNQPAPPSGLEVPDTDPSPSYHDDDLDDDSVSPDYPGAIDSASAIPTGSGSGGGGSGGGGTMAGPANRSMPDVSHFAGTVGGSPRSAGMGGNAGASP